MDDDDIEALRGAPTGELSDEFRDGLWSAIAGKLANGRRTQPNTARRRGVATAAAIILVVAAAAVIVAARNRTTHRVESPAAPTTVLSAPLTSPPSTSVSTSSTTEPTTTTTTTTPTTTALPTRTTLAPAPDATATNPDGPTPAIAGSSIQQATMIDPTTGWVVTDDVIAHTSDAGSTWISHAIPPPFVPADPDVGGSLAGVTVTLDAAHAWVARTDATGTGVIVTRTSDSASTTAETSIVSGIDNGLPNGMAFADAMHGFVSIAPGRVQGDAHIPAALYRTADGGATFEKLSDDAPAPLAFIDANTGWGANDGLFRTADGGVTWTRVYPPGWEAPSMSTHLPSYEIVSTTAARTVVKVDSVIEIQFVATDDDGLTWTDVGPEGPEEHVSTGPDTILTVASATDWYALHQSFGGAPTLWHSADGGGSYQPRALPFSALGIAMATASVGWATTADEIRLTEDGGATWTTIADVIAPSKPVDGCSWQLSLAGHDGAGGTEFVHFNLTNASAMDCPPPTITGVSADAPDLVGVIDAQPGESPIVDPAPADLVLHPGESMILYVDTVTSTDRCGSPPSQRIQSISVTFGASDTVGVPLAFPLETACQFTFGTGVQPTPQS